MFFHKTRTDGARPQRRWVEMLLVMAVVLALVAWLFPGPLRQPGSYLYGSHGDAVKNYYVLAYFVQYDHGQVFTGMNYPRGEHVNFADLQPLLAWLLVGAKQVGLSVSPTAAIATTNWLLLLALVVTAGVLYLILRRLLLPFWYAGLLALIITFLAPQILRFQGHMSLGYSCFLPVQWYMLLRAQAAPRRAGWWVALGSFNVLVGLLAAYHLGISSFWLLAYALVLGLQSGWRRQAGLLGRLVATAVVPLLVFRGWLLLTDHLADRPPNPYGLFEAYADFTSVFSPHAAPLKALWQYIFQTPDPRFEGTVYVGLVGLLVLLCSAVLLVRYAWRRQWRRIGRPVLPAGLRTSLWAAVLLLLLAMAYPFRIEGLEGLVLLLGPLKQFRALGRFAWPFYYVFSAYAAFYIYRLWRYLRQHRAPGFATAWLLPVLLLWAAEAYWHVEPVATGIREAQVTEAFIGPANNYANQLGWSPYRPDSFQAILPLPFFNIGTDKIAIDGTDESRYQAYKASLNLHLPLLTGFLGRSSVSESLRLTQLLGNPLIEKELLPLLPSQKPILLLVTPQALKPDEQRLVGLAQKITSLPEATLYALPVAALAATTRKAALTQARVALPKLFQQHGLFTTTDRGVLYLSFSTQPDRRGRLAPGAYAEPRNMFSTFYDGSLPMPADTGRYEASVWVNAQTGYGLGNFQVKLYRGDELLEHQVGDTRISTDIIGNWVRVAVQFSRPPAANRLELLYENQDLLADDLLVRPLDTDVYWRDAQGQLVLNGYPLGGQ